MSCVTKIAQLVDAHFSHLAQAKPSNSWAYEKTSIETFAGRAANNNDHALDSCAAVSQPA